jgi:hypothetical protein
MIGTVLASMTACIASPSSISVAFLSASEGTGPACDVVCVGMSKEARSIRTVLRMPNGLSLRHTIIFRALKHGQA